MSKSPIRFKIEGRLQSVEDKNSSPCVKDTKSSPSCVDTSVPSSHSLLENPESTSVIYENGSLFSECFTSLREFFFDGVLCDAEIRIGNHSIKCHRVILASLSAYFRSMFTSDMTESREGIVRLSDVDPDAVLGLVQYAYTSKITISTENVQALLFASSVLQVESVIVACCEFMASHIDISNCLEVRYFAEQHGLNNLVQKAETFMIKNFVEVTKDSNFENLNFLALNRIISSDDLTVSGEEVVFEAVMNWVRQDMKVKYKYLTDLLSNIRLAFCSLNFLIDVVSNEESLTTNLECRDLLDKALYYKMFKANLIISYHFKKYPRARKSYAGVIFCVGGRGLAGHPFKTIECYDVCNDCWFPVPDMSARRRHVGVASVDGKLYAVGGHDGAGHLKSGEAFDPTTNCWNSIADMSKLRRGIALAHLNCSIYAIGGLDDVSCFPTVERYDIVSNTWSEVCSMNCSRGGVAVVAYQGSLYAIGGNDGSVSLETCEMYNPRENKWMMIEQMNKRRAGAGATELNGFIFVAGGFDDNAPLESVESYDSTCNQWTLVAQMSCPRGGVGIAALAGKIYAVGGHDGSNYLSSVEQYDPETDKWSQASNISTCRAGAGVVVVNCHTSDVANVPVHVSSTAGIVI